MTARQSGALRALETALADAFRADPALRDLVGGRIHDGPPKAAVAPWLAFGAAGGADWGGGEADGCRLTLAVEAVAGEGERARALAVLDRAATVALSVPLTLGHGRLVLLRQNRTAVVRGRDGRWTARTTFDALVDSDD